MLTKVYKVLNEQLKKNLAEQDLYKNICTEICIKNEAVLQLKHPSFIKDMRTGEDVFPEFAQNDIDKEYEPLIALCFSFSMKNDKVQLEKFKARADFGDFKEVKDFGARMYAMTFGTDVKKATEKSIEILKDIYEADKIRIIKIFTLDIDNGDEYCKNTIIAPKKEPEPVKVDGVAMRVVEEEPKPLPVAPPIAVDKNTEPTLLANPALSTEPVSKADMNDKIYKYIMWIVGIIVAVALIAILMFTNRQNKYNETARTNTAKIVDSLVTESTDTSIYKEKHDKPLEKIVQTTATKEKEENKSEENKIEVVGKWRETDYGNFLYIWQLEKNKITGQYKMIQSSKEGVILELKCIHKKIKRSNEYIFHDVRSERTFTLNAGEEIFYILNFDNNANAILIIKKDAAYLYANDINSQVYDYFATLQPIR